MLTYFIREKIIGKIILAEECPSCGSKNSIEATNTQHYLSILFIPVFPLFKLVSYECTHCKKEVKKTDLSAPSLLAIEKLRSEAKTPLWTYAGVIAIGVIAVIGGVLMSAEKKRNKKLMANPQKGDLLEIKLGDDQYTFYRIDSTRTDSVYLSVADQTATNLYLLSELKPKGDSLFTAKKISLHKSKLLEMVEESVIGEIHRK